MEDGAKWPHFTNQLPRPPGYHYVWGRGEPSSTVQVNYHIKVPFPTSLSCLPAPCSTSASRAENPIRLNCLWTFIAASTEIKDSPNSVGCYRFVREQRFLDINARERDKVPSNKETSFKEQLLNWASVSNWKKNLICFWPELWCGVGVMEPPLWLMNMLTPKIRVRLTLLVIRFKAWCEMKLAIYNMVHGLRNH